MLIIITPHFRYFYQRWGNLRQAMGDSTKELTGMPRWSWSTYVQFISQINRIEVFHSINLEIQLRIEDQHWSQSYNVVCWWRHCLWLDCIEHKRLRLLSVGSRGSAAVTENEFFLISSVTLCPKTATWLYFMGQQVLQPNEHYCRIALINATHIINCLPFIYWLLRYQIEMLREIINSSEGYESLHIIWRLN